MLARVLSAASSRQSLPWETTADVNGIEAFPVEVEVNSGWGDTIILQTIFISPVSGLYFHLAERPPLFPGSKRGQGSGRHRLGRQ